eukprot:scaffold24228_cov64-Attheya_sp.AAC.1
MPDAYGFRTTVGNLQVRYGAGNLAHETSRSKKWHDEATDMSQTSTKDTHHITETAQSLSSYHCMGP